MDRARRERGFWEGKMPLAAAKAKSGREWERVRSMNKKDLYCMNNKNKNDILLFSYTERERPESFFVDFCSSSRFRWRLLARSLACLTHMAIMLKARMGVLCNLPSRPAIRPSVHILYTFVRTLSQTYMYSGYSSENEREKTSLRRLSDFAIKWCAFVNKGGR